ncbi:MAG: bifunctional adenosylcobinamide kinase/adenosylcobinamide-phosphate guanylyltransferase [Caulobacteraceae bacterium]|nr:bifunctional adenosylcobinamide kinase/adenosylcobinamide-phosphate guanylyltransferase [Caulobacter sp.]
MDGGGIAARSCLVVGAARSGKSAYAQALAEADGRAPVYVATAEVYDAEMRARVEAHRAARDGRWRTAEAPLDLGEALARLCAPEAIVLVDCLTLWLTNVMLGGRDVEAAGRDLAAAVPGLAGPVIFVSNEVGAGIVPDNRLARDFRDAQGRLNQAVAQACDAVVLVSAGLPLVLKPAAPPRLRFPPGPLSG